MTLAIIIEAPNNCNPLRCSLSKGIAMAIVNTGSMEEMIVAVTESLFFIPL